MRFTRSCASSPHGAARLPRRTRARVRRAGLAASVSDVVNDEVLTFLRRAERHTLGSVRRQQRLDVDVNYPSQYRLRLIAAELICPTRHGYVDFALPYLREYLREQAAAGV